MHREKQPTDVTPPILVEGAQLLYRSPPPVRIQVLTWAMGALMLCCFVASYWTFGHMTADEAATAAASLGSRLVMSAIIAAVGIVFFGGMMLYLTFYTTQLLQVPGTDAVHVETLRLVGRDMRTLQASQISSASYHAGKVDYHSGQTVDAPWFWVKVQDGRGFLLDIQGEFFDIEAIARLLSANFTTPIGGDVDALRDASTDP